MSFSIYGQGKTKQEAAQSVIKSFAESQPYAPVDALNSLLAGLGRQDEPAAGKQFKLYAGGHASQGGSDSHGYSVDCHIEDLPVEVSAPEAKTDPAATAPAIEVPGTPASS